MRWICVSQCVCVALYQFRVSICMCVNTNVSVHLSVPVCRYVCMYECVRVWCKYITESVCVYLQWALPMHYPLAAKGAHDSPTRVQRLAPLPQAAPTVCYSSCCRTPWECGTALQLSPTFAQLPPALFFSSSLSPGSPCSVHPCIRIPLRLGSRQPGPNQYFFTHVCLSMQMHMYTFVCECVCPYTRKSRRSWESRQGGGKALILYWGKIKESQTQSVRHLLQERNIKKCLRCKCISFIKSEKERYSVHGISQSHATFELHLNRLMVLFTPLYEY